MARPGEQQAVIWITLGVMVFFAVIMVWSLLPS
jgi:hypothetical protein